MGTKKLIVVAAILSIALGACGKAKHFTASALPTLVLSQTESPTGLQFLAQGSGAQTVDQFASDATEKDKLVGFHFQTAYESFFANASALSGLSSGQTAKPDSEIAGSIVVLFKTADDAHKAMAYEHLNDVATGTNVSTVSSKKFGEETIAEQGTQQDLPFPGFVVYWRVGNAVFGVIAAGGTQSNVTIDLVNSLATTVNARAQKA
jgi:hypothetical protein